MPLGKNALDQPIVPILAYCGSSILMTVTNKYVLSGLNFNLNFFLLCIQVSPCTDTRSVELLGEPFDFLARIQLDLCDRDYQRAKQKYINRA